MATIKVTHVGSDLAPKSKKLSSVGRVTAACWHPRRSSNHIQPPLRMLQWGDEELTFMWISDAEKCERLSGQQTEDEQVRLWGPVPAARASCRFGSMVSGFGQLFTFRLQEQAHVGHAHFHTRDDGWVWIAAERRLLLTWSGGEPDCFNRSMFRC